MDTWAMYHRLAPTYATLLSTIGGIVMKRLVLMSVIILALAIQGIPQDASAAVIKISNYGNHICVLTEAGGVKCFGQNGEGALGDGTADYSSVPVNVVDPSDPSGLLTGVVDISAGSASTCAIKENGWAKCWGMGESGQLGNLSFTTSYTPVTVEHDLFWPKLSVSAGIFHVCAVVGPLSGEYSRVQCWGDNSEGELGIGTFEPDKIAAPLDVINLPFDIVSVDTGHNVSCALSGTGGVKCWGSNSGPTGDGYGILGTGEFYGNSPTPQDVVNPSDPTGLLSDVIALDVGRSTACAVIADGQVMCWGDNTYGQLGDQTTQHSSIPVSVIDFEDPSELLSEVVEVSTGKHTCAVLKSGKIKCWGANERGELGNGTETSYNLYPTYVIGLPDDVAAVSVKTGYQNTCALLENGEVWCWGYNVFFPGGGPWVTVPVHVPMDSTPPNILHQVTGSLGQDNWYIGDVTIEFTVTDDESDILSTSGCESIIVDYDTTDVTFTCTATSDGGASSESVTIKRDATAPNVAAEASPPPNSFGWNNTNVTVSFTGTDAMSGIAYCTPDEEVLSLEGPGISVFGTCTDYAGNISAPFTVSGINLDKTPPTVTVTGVAEGATYILGDVPVAGCETFDVLSGVSVEATLTLTGGTTYGTGSFTATCSGAVDFAGNTSPDVAVSYKVITPQTAISSVNDDIEELRDLDILNDGLAVSLTSKLELAIKILDKGAPAPLTRTAVNLLQAFINEVYSLVDEGVLTYEQGQTLIAEAQAIIDALSSP